MNEKSGIFPIQKLPLSKKNDQWKETCVKSIVSRYHKDGNRKQRMKIAYDMFNGEFDLTDLKYVTNPYKVEEGFPAKIQNFNIIRPKIELLIGEETKRPDNFFVYRTDEAIVEDVETRQKEMIYNVLESSIMQNQNINAEEDVEYLQKRLNEIKNYIGKKYYDPAEQTANKILKYLSEKLSLKEETLKGWGDALKAGEEHYYTGIINGEPVLERVNPLYFAFDADPELKYVDEGEWACRFMWMTPSAVYDRFFDLMDESDLDKVLENVNSYNASLNNKGSKLNTDYILYKEFDNVGANNMFYNYIDHEAPVYGVYHATWRSYKKIGYLTYIDEDGIPQIAIVDETYKKQENEEIEWDWIIEWWEGYQIGEDIFIGMQPIEYQDISIDNPNAGRGVYTGAVYNNDNSDNKSLVDIMKPLQYMYLTIWYRLELTLARDKGKVLVMDITQIPKSMGVDEKKWLHYLSAMGVTFVNPYDTGWDIPGREGGKASQFNQIQAVDLTMANVLNEYIGLMNKIEEMIGELSGVSKARQGQIHQSSLVGNVQQEIIQSSHITERLFWKHNQIKRRAFTNLLNIAKYAYKVNNKQKINYILNDSERAFVNITDDFIYSDYDVFVSDSSKEYQDIQQLQQLYQPAMQNGASLLDVASIMTSENMSEIKIKLEDIEQRRAEMIKAEQDANNQMEQSKAQLEQERLRIDEEDSIRKAETDITVAQIQAASKQNNEVIEDNSLEEDKLQHIKDKDNKDQQLKEKQLEETIRHNFATEQISRTAKKNTNNKN